MPETAIYDFRTATDADLVQLQEWLVTPEALAWWGDPAAELKLIEEDLCTTQMRQWIVSVQGQPFAYAQAYEVHAWPQPHLSHLPQGTMAIDAFIGVPDFLNRGHGSRFLRQLALMLLSEGAPKVAIDPDADNSRAIAAYRKAGFAAAGLPIGPGNTVLLMLFSH